MSTAQLIASFFLLFPANLIFLLSLFRSSRFFQLKASTGVFYFLVFNSVYLVLVLEAYLINTNLNLLVKILIASGVLIIVVFWRYKKRIEKWLIKKMKLTD